MEYKIRSKKVKVTDDIKTYVEKRLQKLDKYFANPDGLVAKVMIRQAGHENVVEVTIPVKRMVLRAEEVNKDIKSSVDLVLDKLERQIRKNKTRMSKRGNKDKYSELDLSFDTEKEEKDTTKIVRKKDIELKPMSEEEAILQMNMIDHDFFLFRNVKSGEANVVYRRKDGNYGLIREK